MIRIISSTALRFATATVLSLSVAGSALALDDVKLMAPASPGGGWDQTARALQTAMTTANVAKSVQVTNVPGAGGAIGLAQFAGDKGNGQSMMVAGMVMVGALLTNKSPVDLSQTTPLARLTGEYEVIVVPADSPFKNLSDLVKALKADPGKVAFAGGSAGGTDHILVGLFAKAVGVDPTKINYVPFSGGGEALAALLGNQVAAGVSGWGEFEGQIKAGKLRALAISAPQKIPGIDVPTAKEQGVNLELANWRAVFGPSGLSETAKMDQLKAIDAAVKSASWQETLKQKGWDNQYLAGDKFVTYLAEEQTRIAGVLKEIGLVK
ncbi:MAG: tripartite tricarboxylate transporter substrate-binding protein [Alphaproteobacteria bacterium]